MNEEYKSTPQDKIQWRKEWDQITALLRLEGGEKIKSMRFRQLSADERKDNKE